MASLQIITRNVESERQGKRELGWCEEEEGSGRGREGGDRARDGGGGKNSEEIEGVRSRGSVEKEKGRGIVRIRQREKGGGGQRNRSPRQSARRP